jgi:hypothetical protein
LSPFHLFKFGQMERADESRGQWVRFVAGAVANSRIDPRFPAENAVFRWLRLASIGFVFVALAPAEPSYSVVKESLSITGHRTRQFAP